jgi:glycerol-3-phosphate dehydrogenase subunit C
MTATYDPTDPQYFDPAALRVEMDRVFDLCHGCRLCFNLCPSFPTMFGFIDAKDGDVHGLSDAEHDQVVDECYQCKLCYVKCPYVPPHEWKLDFPRLMSRVHAVRKQQGTPIRERLTDQFLSRTDLLGRVSVPAAPVVNWATGTPGSLPRRVMEKTVGLASERLLPPYARQRFTTWFKRRKGPATSTGERGAVSVFPTCFVEYMDPDVGRDLVRVYEHNGVACSVPEGTKCCGAPWLHSGNLEQFGAVARRNVAALAAEVRAGRDVVVAQPTCAYVIKKDYPLYVKGADAELVAEHTYDPAEYLIKRHKDGDDPFALREDFPGRDAGAVPDAVTYHLACHLQAQNIGLKSRDLLKVAGVKCTLVQRCSGIDGTWGYRAENYDLARKVAAPLAKEVLAAGNDVVCGDCHLANGAILQETGLKPQHPLQLMARAYGLAEDS